MKTSADLPKIKVIKTVGKKSQKQLYVVVSNYCSKGADTVLMKLPSSWYNTGNEVYKN